MKDEGEEKLFCHAGNIMCTGVMFPSFFTLRVLFQERREFGHFSDGLLYAVEHRICCSLTVTKENDESKGEERRKENYYQIKALIKVAVQRFEPHSF